MPVSGLLLTLSTRGDLAEAALDRLKSDPKIEVGSAHGRRLPIVLDTSNRAENDRYWQRLQEDPGIAYIDVTCVYFDQEVENPDRGPRSLSVGPVSPPPAPGGHRDESESTDLS